MTQLVSGINPSTKQSVPMQVDANGVLAVSIGAATVNATVNIDPVVVVNGGAGQTADIKTTLDGEAVVLGAGSAAFGKLAANHGVDIGTVDVQSLPALAAGTNLAGKVGIDQVTAHANEVVVTSAPLPTVGTVIPYRVALTGGQTAAAAYTPTSGKRYKLLRATVSCYVGGTLSLFDGTDSASTAVLPVLQLSASSGLDSAWKTEAPRTSAAVNTPLRYTTSASFVGSLYLELIETT